MENLFMVVPQVTVVTILLLGQLARYVMFPLL